MAILQIDLAYIAVPSYLKNIFRQERSTTIWSSLEDSVDIEADIAASAEVDLDISEDKAELAVLRPASSTPILDACPSIWVEFSRTAADMAVSTPDALEVSDAMADALALMDADIAESAADLAEASAESADILDADSDDMAEELEDMDSEWALKAMAILLREAWTFPESPI
jgi:hypothetical protein